MTFILTMPHLPDHLVVRHSCAAAFDGTHENFLPLLFPSFADSTAMMTTTTTAGMVAAALIVIASSQGRPAVLLADGVEPVSSEFCLSRLYPDHRRSIASTPERIYT